MQRPCLKHNGNVENPSLENANAQKKKINET